MRSASGRTRVPTSPPRHAMHIRPFRPGEEPALRAVFVSAVHGIARHDYTHEQIEAWAPPTCDPEAWAKRVQAIGPFVVEHRGEILAYADVQADGYIDHFFVSARHARQGIGSLLMAHLHTVAATRAIALLSSDVSRTAQPFFEKFGFAVTEQRSPVIRGVTIPNARMCKHLPPEHQTSAYKP